ncbi:MAG: acetyl-CoA C-acyltransferase [Comamonas sp.]|nr:acetyl-CoA C-acyltransferase [Comamonas sp.]
MAVNLSWPIVGWARTPVAPVGGALAQCTVPDLTTPLITHLLRRAGLPAEAVDAVVLGNALGANGNPARLAALAAGLPDRVAAWTVDSQCCAGLDAITHACGLLALGQAEVVIAGGAEAWSRAPIRSHRPRHAGETSQAYERPAFAPAPRDRDMLDAAAAIACQHTLTRPAQDAWAVTSHARALAYVPGDEVVPVAGWGRDVYPRALTLARAVRMPAVRPGTGAQGADCSLSTVAISPKADGAALLLLASPAACQRWGLRPRAQWQGAASLGAAPEAPMLAAQQAAQQLLQNQGLAAADVEVVELHDAFAAQALAFVAALGLPLEAINRQGGGLARGHPIGASGAIALVQALAQLQPGQRALAAIAGAGGLGSAILVRAFAA